MQSPPDTPAARLMHGFWNLRQTFIERISPRLREQIGLEVPDVLLLGYIGSSTLSPSEIAAQMRLPPHAISRRLDGLEKRGLITRRLARGDARRRVLTLTPAGGGVLETGRALLEQHVDQLLAVLDPETRDTMLGALERLATAQPAPKEPPL